MKLTYKAYDTEVTIKTDRDDHTIYEMADYLRRLLLAASFHPYSVNDILDES